LTGLKKYVIHILYTISINIT